MKISNMKGWAAALILGIGMSVGAANAQTAPDKADRKHDRKEMMEKRAQHMKEKLELSDAQVAQIKAIRESKKEQFKADLAALKAAEGKEARQAAALKLKADRQAMQEQIKTILTPEQQQKAKEMKQNFNEHRKERKGRRNKQD